MAVGVLAIAHAPGAGVEAAEVAVPHGAPDVQVAVAVNASEGVAHHEAHPKLVSCHSTAASQRARGCGCGVGVGVGVGVVVRVVVVVDEMKPLSHAEQMRPQPRALQQSP